MFLRIFLTTSYKCWHYKFEIDTMVVDCKDIFIFVFHFIKEEDDIIA